jgi:hypothetical protein
VSSVDRGRVFGHGLVLRRLAVRRDDGHDVVAARCGAGATVHSLETIRVSQVASDGLAAEVGQRTEGVQIGLLQRILGFGGIAQQRAGDPVQARLWRRISNSKARGSPLRTALQQAGVVEGVGRDRGVRARSLHDDHLAFMPGW